MKQYETVIRDIPSLILAHHLILNYFLPGLLNASQRIRPTVDSYWANMVGPSLSKQPVLGVNLSCQRPDLKSSWAITKMMFINWGIIQFTGRKYLLNTLKYYQILVIYW